MNEQRKNLLNKISGAVPLVQKIFSICRMQALDPLQIRATPEVVLILDIRKDYGYLPIGKKNFPSNE